VLLALRSLGTFQIWFKKQSPSIPQPQRAFQSLSLYLLADFGVPRVHQSREYHCEQVAAGGFGWFREAKPHRDNRTASQREHRYQQIIVGVEEGDHSPN